MLEAVLIGVGVVVLLVIVGRRSACSPNDRVCEPLGSHRSRRAEAERPTKVRSMRMQRDEREFTARESSPREG